MTQVPPRLKPKTAVPGSLHSSSCLPPMVLWFWIASLLLFATSLVYSALGYRAGLPQPRWDPLCDPFLGDFMEYPATYRLLHTAAFFDNRLPGSLPPQMFSSVAYPPFAAALLAPLYLLPNPASIFFFTALCTLLNILWLVREAFVRAGISKVTSLFLPLSLLIVSFPIQRLIHEGNVELIVWMLAAAGLQAIHRKNLHTAASLWGLAGALKLYPLLLLTLLLPQRRLRAFCLGCSIFTVATLISLHWLGPTFSIAWKGSLHNFAGYQNLRASEWTLRELVANHSAFNVVKLLAQISHVPSSTLTFPYYLTCIILLALAFFIRLQHMPFVNQLLALSAAMLIVPSISYYHTLVHLYAPLLAMIGLAIRAHKKQIYVRGLQGTLLLYLPLFVPYTLLTFPRFLLFCGVIQSLVLCTLFLCAMQYPFTLPETTESALEL